MAGWLWFIGTPAWISALFVVTAMLIFLGLTRIVVSRPGSIMAEQADILLPVHWRENQDILRPPPGRYAFLATVDILSQTIAARLGPPAVASMRRIKHQLVVNRDGDDAQPLGD